MTEWRIHLIVSFLALLVFWPWLLGVIDIAAFILVGHTVSPIPWTTGPDGRVIAAACWPIVAAPLVGAFAAMTS